MKGHPAKTLDNSVLIAWTPDPEWLEARIMESDGEAKKIAALIDEASRRPQQPKDRPRHEPLFNNFWEVKL